MYQFKRLITLKLFKFAFRPVVAIRYLWKRVIRYIIIMTLSCAVSDRLTSFTMSLNSFHAHGLSYHSSHSFIS